MANVFRTFIIPPAALGVATQICDDLGYPEKGMFTSIMVEGPPPPMGEEDLRPVQGYISTGLVADDCPLLLDAEGLHAALLERNPDSTVTLVQCTMFTTWLDLTDVQPIPRQEFMLAEINGSPAVLPESRKGAKAQETADAKFNAKLREATGTEEGYPMNAVVYYQGFNMRNLLEGNLTEPAFGVPTWRKVWTLAR